MINQEFNPIINNQPKSGDWQESQNKCTGLQNVRPGLERLANIKKLKLIQHLDVLEAAIGWQQKNSFKLIDPDTNETVGTFKEKSDDFERQMHSNLRKFKAKVTFKRDTGSNFESNFGDVKNSDFEDGGDNDFDGYERYSKPKKEKTGKRDKGKENKDGHNNNREKVVMFKIQRPRKHNCFLNPGCICECPDLCCQEGKECAQTMRVTDRDGNKIAKIKQEMAMTPCAWTNCVLSHIVPYYILFAVCCTDSSYFIYDENDVPKYILRANMWNIVFTCCEDIKIGIYDAQNQTDRVGSFTKVWKSGVRGHLTTADDFMIKFPPEATPEMKAGIISAVILWDYNFWESSE